MVRLLEQRTLQDQRTAKGGSLRDRTSLRPHQRRSVRQF